MANYLMPAGRLTVGLKLSCRTARSFELMVCSVRALRLNGTLCSPVVTIMYRQFNIQQFYALPTQCVYVFCVDLRTNSDYFSR